MFGRKKQILAYDSVFQAPDNVVDIPPPTEDDIRWARALGGKISNDEFIEICISKNLWRLEYCIQAGKKLNSSRFPLFCHIYYSKTPCPKVVKLLLAHEANPSNMQSSALRTAVKKRYKDIAFVLFEYNVDIAKAKKALSITVNRLFASLDLNTDDKIYLDRIYDEWQGRTLEDTLSDTPPEAGAETMPSWSDIKCPDPAVNLPAPTAEDIKWAEKHTVEDIKPKQIQTLIKKDQQWRLQYILGQMPKTEPKAEYVSYAAEENNATCIRIIYANGTLSDICPEGGVPLGNAAYCGSEDALNTLYDLGADLSKAMQNASTETLAALIRFKEKREGISASKKNNEGSDDVWTARSNDIIMHERIVETQFGVSNIVKTFNFKSRKVESFVQSETAISPPSSENFDTQPTETEIRKAHAELKNQGFTPPPLEEVLSSKRKADPVTVNLGTTRKQHP